MILTRHPSETCWKCSSRVLFGLKEEPAGWKVVVTCDREECAYEATIGRIARASVGHEDALYDRAETMVAKH